MKEKGEKYKKVGEKVEGMRNCGENGVVKTENKEMGRERGVKWREKGRGNGNGIK